MREMLAITGAIKGAGLGKDVLLMTDGRFSGDHRAVRGTRRPEAVDGGPIAFVTDGDRIRLDVANGTLDILVDAGELDERKVGFTRRHPGTRPGFWPSTASSSAQLPAARSATDGFLRPAREGPSGLARRPRGAE